MKKLMLLIALALLLLVPGPGTAADTASDKAGDAGGCAPQYRALAAAAVVEIPGAGEAEVVVLTDPLCRHCRLAYKLLGEYPEMFSGEKLLFFPRQSFTGSDMAAWVLEDAAGAAHIKALVDFAYTELRQPQTDNLDEARMLILAQFTEAFPAMLKRTTLSDLFDRLKRDHEAHVLAEAALARAANVPGTPVLIAGPEVVIGYGPDEWLEAIGRKGVCP
jgi:hypothetical protein